MAATSVSKLYDSVIDDVINNVREAFMDEGVDEQILTELKQTWEKKLVESKAIEQQTEPVPQRTSQSVSTAHQQVQQGQPQSSPQITTSAIAHHLTGNLVQQGVLQYATAGAGGDGQKTVTLGVPQKVTLTLPTHITPSLQTLMSGPAGTTTLALSPELAASLLHQAALSQGSVLHTSQTQSSSQQGLHYQTITADQLQKASHFNVAVTQPTSASQSQTTRILQLDGANDTSDDEDDDDYQDEEEQDDNDDEQNEDENEGVEEEEDPLNSNDDVSDEDSTDLFDTENVVVCQYDKITRSKNRWKFHLKDGIMNLQGKDYVFQKALGDSEW